jgi:hypothetical protein
MTVSPLETLTNGLSVSMLEASGSAMAPPFIRFNLNYLFKMTISGRIEENHHLGLPLPSVMEDLRVPLEQWNMLWAKIEPIVQTMKRRERLMLGLLLVGMVGSIAICWLSGVSLLFIFFLLQAIVLWVGDYFRDCLREADMKKIRSICMEEEQQVFRSYGVALECDYEKFNVGRVEGIYLYFILINSNRDEAEFQNGYLRVDIWEKLQTPVWFGWNIMSPSLPSSDYLPSGMESLYLDEWTAFWSKLDTLNHLYISCARKVTVTMFSLLVVLFGHLLLVLSSYDDSWLQLANDFIFLVAFISAWCLLSHLDGMITERNALVNEYRDKFAEQGVYMEYRIHVNRHGLASRYISHHLYLFPTSGHTARSIEPAQLSLLRT